MMHEKHAQKALIIILPSNSSQVIATNFIKLWNTDS